MPPGPGTNAVRTFYEEFTVGAASGYSLLVDSLLLTTAINNSTAGHLGVSYSTDGFATVSEVTGGTLPTAMTTAQPAGATGSFTNQANIPNVTSGPVINTYTFRLALNAATGVAVASGQTLSIRLYYGVGSSGTPRQAQLKAVSAKGVSAAACNATFAYGGSSFCQSGTTNPQPTITGTAGGTFSSTTGLTLAAATGAITLSSSTPGTYTVTYAVAGACGSSSTQMLTITAAPAAAFSYATPGTGAACAGGAGTFAPTLASGATAGAFTSTAGLVLNATTGAISLAGSTAGTYTVTNTVAASNGCAAVASTATFTVNPVPATPTLTATGTLATGITLTSSAAAGNQFYLNGSPIAGATGQTYLVNSGARNGFYTVVVTGTGGCASATSAAVNVTVTAVAGVQAGPELKLYPNPTPDGRLTLELAGYHETVQLSLCNALGQQVWSRAVAPAALTSPQSLDLSALPTGLYVLQARTASGEQLVRRLVRE